VFTGGIASGMQDTRYAVGSFKCERNFAVYRIERHTKIDQVSDAVRSFISQDVHYIFIAQTVTGSDGIVIVQFGGIVGTDGGGNSTLSMAGIAVFNAALGYHKDTAVLIRKQGTIQACDTAAD
jgi:hypothetical protein